MSRQRSCSSATTSPICRRTFYNTLLESQRGNLSDAELRQKKDGNAVLHLGELRHQGADKHADQRELSVRVCAERALGCSTSGFDQMRLALQQQIPVMNVNGYRLPDGNWYPQSEQPENDLLNDYHNAEYAQIFDAKKSQR